MSIETDVTAKCFLDAADLLERSGWTRHHYQTAGGFCMAGAISQVCPSRWIPSARPKTCHLLGFTDQVDLFSYNDYRAADIVEVTTLLRSKASDLLRGIVP